MSSEALVRVVEILVGGLIALGAWLLKLQLSRIVEAVDRLPDRAWFERVQQSMETLATLVSQNHEKRLLAVEKRLRRIAEKTDPIGG